MKHTYILMIGVIYLLSSCEPNKNINASIDNIQDSIALFNAKNANKAIAIPEYTLTDDDYKLSSIENLAKYKSFSNDIKAKEHLPEILNHLFFSKQAGYEMYVGYKYYYPSSKEKHNSYDYQIQESDYTNVFELENTYFSNEAEGIKLTSILIEEKLSRYKPSLTTSIIEFRYAGTQMCYSTMQFNGVGWDEINWARIGHNSFIEEDIIAEAYEVTNEDYEDIEGEVATNRYLDANTPKTVLDTVLTKKISQAESGDIHIIKYKYYAIDNISRVTFSKTSDDKWAESNEQTLEWSYAEGWILKTNSHTPIEYGTYTYRNELWEYVIPIKLVITSKQFTKQFNLTASDYEMVGNGSYYNFDIREGKTDAPIAVRINKFTSILKANGSAKIGDIYEISYDVYTDDGSGTNTIILEVLEDEK